MKRSTKLKRTLRARWPLIAGITALILLLALYFFRLGNLGLDPIEQTLAAQNAVLSRIVHDPLNAPYKFVAYAFRHLWPQSVLAARVPAVLWTAAASVLLFFIIKRWHRRRAAILAVTLFATSGWLLHTGRLAEGLVMSSVLPLALLLLSSWAASTKRHNIAVIIFPLIITTSLFIPGGVWFAAIAALLTAKEMKTHFAEASKLFTTIGSLVALGIMLGLALALSHQPALVKPWLGLPVHWPPVGQFFKQWLESVTFIFVHGPSAPRLWLGHQPILSAFGSVMTILGGYFYLRHWRNKRAELLAGFIIIASLLEAVSGVTSLGFEVALAYVLAGTGLAYFLQLWLHVFPRNPIAKHTAAVLLAIAVALTAVYHTVSYYVAWPSSPDTAHITRQNLL
jgi:hypothetical protein